MNYFDKILHLIISKKKQIIFALFALICYIFDNNSSNILASAAPLVVATAAGAGSATTAGGVAATTGAAASAAGAATATSATGGTAAATNAVNSTSKIASSLPKSGMAKEASGSMNDFAKPNNLKNTNPKYNMGSMNPESSLPLSDSATDILSEKKGIKETAKNNFIPSSSKDMEEDFEEEVTMESASKELIPKSGMNVVGCILGSMFLFIISVPLVILLLINASSSTMSQVDCSMQEGSNCVEEEVGLLHKLKNLFKYGSYGSNSEIVLKKIEDAYNDIKEEYDFIINLPLLTSSLFSDTEYIKTDVEEGNIVITDKMLERIEYVRDMAELQMISKFHIFYCSRTSYYNEETDSYESDYQSTYQYTTEDEDAVVDIPTAECNSSTANSLIKKVTYYFDEEKYFKRLEPSEELDLVYSDFEEADKMLVSKIRNQYHLYNYMNQIVDLSEYEEAPMELEFDTNVNLQSPLKGWMSITSPFGMREGEYAGMHDGIDLVASDKSIYAAGNGVVTRSNVEKEGGNVIEITHTDINGVQYVTQYAHLRERLVSLGDTVSANDVIGIMGDTGTMASGVHLHFTMWRKEPYELINPRKLFSEASNY